MDRARPYRTRYGVLSEKITDSVGARRYKPRPHRPTPLLSAQDLNGCTTTARGRASVKTRRQKLFPVKSTVLCTFSSMPKLCAVATVVMALFKVA